MEVPDLPKEVEKSFDKFSQIMAGEALRKAKEQFGPLSPRDVEMIHKVAWVVSCSLLQTHKWLDSYFKDNTKVQDYWMRTMNSRN